MIDNLKPYSVTVVRLLWYNQEPIGSRANGFYGKEKMTM